MKFQFSGQIFEKKKLKISSFMKIRPAEVDLFHADGRDEANSRFSEFCKRA
jgi:hypothetical protein